jgi:prolyl-tRNA synthetase
MKDMYCFAATEEDNQKFYEKAKAAYGEVFKRVGLGDKTYITSASGGVFTDKHSHEFQTICEAGEDNIFVNKETGEAVNEEIYQNQEGFEKIKAAEVGNIFNFGSRKCEQMGLQYKDQNGNVLPVFLSSYGVGITRLLAVLAEVMSDEKGLVWPEAIAPFKYHLILIPSSNEAVKKAAEEIYKKLGADCLYDDRDTRAGEKFADADLLGMPIQIIVSERSLENGGVELKDRKTGETKIVSAESLN